MKRLILWGLISIFCFQAPLLAEKIKAYYIYIFFNYAVLYILLVIAHVALNHQQDIVVTTGWEFQPFSQSPADPAFPIADHPFFVRTALEWYF